MKTKIMLSLTVLTLSQTLVFAAPPARIAEYMDRVVRGSGRSREEVRNQVMDILSRAGISRLDRVRVMTYSEHVSLELVERATRALEATHSDVMIARLSSATGALGNETSRAASTSGPRTIVPEVVAPTRPNRATLFAAVKAEVSQAIDQMLQYQREEIRDEVKSFLEQIVFVDPNYLNNPREYARNWRTERGFFDNLNLPSDPALEFIEALERAGQSQAFIERLRSSGMHEPRDTFENRAARSAVRGVFDQYCATELMYVEQNTRQAIFEFLERSVFVDPSFLRKPGDYIHKWREIYGGNEAFNVPEGPALSFLEAMVRMPEARGFIRNVRASGGQVTAGPNALSTEWARRAQGIVLEVL